MTPWLVAVFCLATAGCSNVTDQQTSESQNEQVAILKQLRKVNDDGSYTFGYEAGDGSFKVETRDVLGNVKGTFGFVDGNGEVKRVTYSSSNGTGFKATTISPLQERPSVVQAIPRANRSSSSTRRPISMSTSTESSLSSSTLSTSSTSSTSSTINSKLNLGQSILRSKVKTTPMPSSSASNSTTTESVPKTTFGSYLKSTKRPRLFTNGQHRSTSTSESGEQESADNADEDSQITRPTIEAKAATQRKNYFIKRTLDHTLRPITEEFEEKEEESKSAVSGNNLRRQLQEETTIKVEESPESSDEHSDVYHGGSLSTPRPLFTTTNNPKVIQRIRMERPKILYHHNNHQQQVKSSADENYGPAQFDDNKYQNARAYEAENKVSEQEREAPEQFIYRVPHARVSPRDYVRNMDPVYIRRQQQILRDLPPGLFVQPQNNEEEEYQPPVERILARLQARAYPRPNEPENIDYISEAPVQPAMEPVQPQAPPPPPVPAPATVNQQNYIHPRQFARLIRPYVMDHEPRSRPYMRLHQADEKDYMDGYYRNVVLPPEAPNPIAPPLSRRDFQLLLRRLLVSQYGVQALSHPRTYLDHALYDEQSYPYQRPRLMYEEPVPVPRPRLMPAIDPLYNSYYQEPNPNYQDPRYSRRVYRQKFYDQDTNEPDENNHGDEILPPPVREALLLRMLQLAINNQRAMTPNTILMSTTPSSSMTPVTTSVYRKSGPVRSVQIITDEKSEDKDDRKKL